MPKRVQIPSVNLWRGFEAVDNLLVVLAPLWDDARPLVLDFSACDFVSADAVAVLTVLKLERAQQDAETRIDWSTMNGKVMRQFGRWEVASVFGAANHRWTDNAIPLLHQRKC